MTSTSEYRIKRLREIETVCYRICYHVVSCEALAHESAKLTLRRLYACEAFFEADAAEQAAWLRREAVSASMKLYMEREEGNAVGA